MSTTTKERPILFRPELVRKILDGKKWMTRRPVKPQPVNNISCDYDVKRDTLDYVWTDDDWREFRSPFGYAGDVLWVRESVRRHWIGGHSNGVSTEHTEWRYGDGEPVKLKYPWPTAFQVKKAIPSIHLPRDACRLRLEITDVRVERVQSISESDAVAEGMERIELTSDTMPGVEPPFNRVHPMTSTYAAAFEQAWEKAYPGSWAKNEWVWAISFKRIT